MNLPWVLIGDVNEPLEEKDKRGGRLINRNLAAQLSKTIDNCKLIDMGFQGPQFTWSNGRKGKANIRERIDRAWYNTWWNQAFEGTYIKHLTRVASDHHPLLLTEVPRGHTQEFKGFRFMEAWFLNPEFPKEVEEFWNEESRNRYQTIEQFKTNI